jgi:hypothetical protein
LAVTLFNLTFNKRFDYDQNDNGIYFDIELIADNDNPVSVRAKLDTGADYCIFQRIYADFLDLEVENGIEMPFLTATNNGFTAFGHEINIRFFDIEFTTTVYFVADENFRVSVLGRNGFFNQFIIGLIDQEQLLFIDSLENYYQTL